MIETVVKAPLPVGEVLVIQKTVLRALTLKATGLP